MRLEPAFAGIETTPGAHVSVPTVTLTDTAISDDLRGESDCHQVRWA